MTMDDPLGEKLKAEGLIQETMSFNVKYDQNTENTETHLRFKGFAKKYARNNYLESIRLLMDYWDTGAQVGLLNEKIDDIDERLTVVEEGQRLRENRVRTLG